ncbi:hypothetical protein JYT53_00255 [Cytophagaceae bacterium AH-315-L13]|nr:hypothetical protein [Cytophagaceae bacterium AH-315-L13]
MKYHIRKALINFISSCILLVLSLPAISQQYHFRNYSVQDGLIQSQITSIIQDSRGYLWLGTYEGLSRFDGERFKNYTKDNGLLNPMITSVFEDSKGNIWIGSRAGVSKFDGINFTNFTPQDGLVKGGIFKIFEDSKGNLWFAALNKGISKLIAKDLLDSSITFQNYDVHTNSRYWFNVPFLEAKYGKIWMASANHGVCVFTDNSIVNITAIDGLIDNGVRDIIEDSKGNIWIAASYGISFLSNDNNRSGAIKGKFKNTNAGHFFSPLIGEDQKYAVVKIFEDSKQYIWLIENKMIAKINLNNLEERQNFIFKEGFHASDIYEDKYRKIWFVGKFGFAIYDPDKTDYEKKLINGEHITVLDPIMVNNGIPKITIYKSVIDKENNLWLGHNGAGITKFQNAPFQMYTTKDGLHDNNTWSLLEDRKGNIWFGTHHEGIIKYDGKTFDKIRFREKSEFFEYRDVCSIMEDKEGNLWLGYPHNLVKLNIDKDNNINFNFFSADKLPFIGNGGIFALIQDKNDNIWFGHYNNGLTLYQPNEKLENQFKQITTEDGLAGNAVRKIIEDAKSNLWIATNGGVSVYDGNKFTNLTTNQGLISNRVKNILEDRLHNKFWIGTEEGLSVYSPSVLKNVKGKFDNYTLKDGLSGNFIYLMIFDDDRNVWVGTSRGVDKIVLDGIGNLKKIINYGTLEGFMGVETSLNSTCKDSKGNLWFGTVNGVVKYTPILDIKNDLEPQTYITGVKLFFEEVDWASDTIEWCNGVTKWHGLPRHLNLPYDKNHLTFDFTSISLTIPEKVKYQYKLEGLDNDWSPFTNKTEITYSKLDPGKYAFKVKACNDEGIWNKEPTVYSFRIELPYWETGWFMGVQVLFFSVIIAATLFLSRSGKYESILTIFVFITLFLVFDYIQNLCEPFYEAYIGSAPLVKSVLNLMLAALLLPAQRYLRKVLRGKRQKVIHERLDDLV